MYKTNAYHYGLIPSKVFELPAICQKSFYGKAKIIIAEGEIFLQSYDTIVCYINKNGDFIRLWDGYSSTTARHINDFCTMYNLPTLNKKEWESMNVEYH